MAVIRTVPVLRISLELHNVFPGKNSSAVKNVLKVACVHLLGKEHYTFIIIPYCIVNLTSLKVTLQIKHGTDVKLFKTIQYDLPCFCRCPVYQGLPSQCHVVKQPGQCCGQVYCNFTGMISKLVTTLLTFVPY